MLRAPQHATRLKKVANILHLLKRHLARFHLPDAPRLDGVDEDTEELTVFERVAEGGGGEGDAGYGLDPLLCLFLLRLAGVFRGKIDTKEGRSRDTIAHVDAGVPLRGRI